MPAVEMSAAPRRRLRKNASRKNTATTARRHPKIRSEVGATTSQASCPAEKLPCRVGKQPCSRLKLPCPARKLRVAPGSFGAGRRSVRAIAGSFAAVPRSLVRVKPSFVHSHRACPAPHEGDPCRTVARHDGTLDFCAREFVSPAPRELMVGSDRARVSPTSLASWTMVTVPDPCVEDDGAVEQQAVSCGTGRLFK